MATRRDTFNDTQAVLTAAHTLDISEFELFNLAYQNWHGQRAETRQLEAVFVRYLFEAKIPHWVRHFTSYVASLNYSEAPLQALQSSAQVNRGVLVC